MWLFELTAQKNKNKTTTKNKITRFWQKTAHSHNSRKSMLWQADNKEEGVVFSEKGRENVALIFSWKIITLSNSTTYLCLGQHFPSNFIKKKIILLTGELPPTPSPAPALLIKWSLLYMLINANMPIERDNHIQDIHMLHKFTDDVTIYIFIMTS